MMFDPNLVSVITPFYNSKKFLSRVVECVQCQLDVTFEHIIVDDNSSDGSWAEIVEISRRFKNIKIFRLDKNTGPVAARNVGISLAEGRFLAFLDADDYWLPSKLYLQLKFMLSSRAAMSYTDYRCISEDGRFIGSRLNCPSRIGIDMHHMTRYIGCLTVMIDRNQCVNFDFENISPAYRAEDFLAWSSVIAHHKYALHCPHDLARYAVVENSRSSKSIRAAISVWLLYRDVEKLSLIRSGFYYLAYLLFSSFKKVLLKPKRNSILIDGELANSYILNPAK